MKKSKSRNSVHCSPRPRSAKRGRLFTDNSLKRGFTLLELIIALSILSMVAIIIGSGFRLGIKAWEKGEAETRETQRLRALSGLISQSVKSAYPYKMHINDEDVILFEGEKNSITFATAFVDSRYGGFKWIRYLYRDGALIFKEGILPDKDFSDHTSKDEEIIDSDIGEIIFEYHSSETDEWKESWSLEDKLPDSIRVKIAYFQPFLITIPLGTKDKKSELKEF